MAENGNYDLTMMYRKNTKLPDKHHIFNSLNVFFFTDDFLIVPGGEEILRIPYQRVVESYKGERRDTHKRKENGRDNGEKWVFFLVVVVVITMALRDEG